MNENFLKFKMCVCAKFVTSLAHCFVNVEKKCFGLRKSDRNIYIKFWNIIDLHVKRKINEYLQQKLIPDLAISLSNAYHYEALYSTIVIFCQFLLQKSSVSWCVIKGAAAAEPGSQWFVNFFAMKLNGFIEPYYNITTHVTSHHSLES